MSRNIAFLIGFLVALLSFRFYFFYHNQPQYKDGQSINFTTTLDSEPRLVGNKQILTANLASGNKIFITTPAFPNFHYGQTIKITGNLKVRLLKNKNKVLNLYFPQIKAVKKSQSIFISSFLAFTSSVRQHIIDFYSRNLPPDYSSLMLGIVFGIQETLSSDLSQNLRNTGVYHVVAASGMNISMVSVFLISLFQILLRRKIALIGTVTGIIFYASLAGFEPSIVRASIMGIIAFSAQILGRQSLAIFSLVLAALAMLFLSPNLITDIGFQLSFLATLGLLYLNPFFGRILRIKGDILTTVSAQTATLPVLLANFGSYPAFSIIGNFFVLWTIPILMIIGGVSAIASFIFSPLAKFLLFLSMPLIFYFEKVIELIAKISPIFKVDFFPWQLVAGYYFLLVSILLFLKRKNQ